MYSSRPGSASSKNKATFCDERTLKTWPATSNKNKSSILQEIEYHSSSSYGNQSNASITTEQLRQQMNHIIPDAALAKDDDRNWSAEDIAPGNDNKIMIPQHGNGPNDVSALRYAISLQLKSFYRRCSTRR